MAIELIDRKESASYKGSIYGSSDISSDTTIM